MTVILGYLIKILAEMGIAWGFDKLLPEPVPPAPTPFYHTGLSKLSPIKMAVIAVIISIGVMIFITFARMLKIKLPKT